MRLKPLQLQWKILINQIELLSSNSRKNLIQLLLQSLRNKQKYHKFQLKDREDQRNKWIKNNSINHKWQ